MSDLSDVRTIALALPEATEQDHHGMASFRVGGRIFATVPDPGHVRVMLDEPAIEAALAEHPDVWTPFSWGSRLTCVVVDVRRAPHAQLRELLTDAWLRRAPRRLAQQHLAHGH